MTTDKLLGEHLEKTVFILSTGRTGSKALAQFLDDAFPDVTALHEPNPSYRLRLRSCAYLSNKISRESLIRSLSHARRALISRIETPVYVESNPFLFGHASVLPEVFHRVKVAHVVRDPRTYIRSCINFGSYRGIKGWVNARLPHC